jgi:threonylcarbamoyladenosine tRNA methylthiotransferase MtaB
MLASMRRRYKRELYASRVALIKHLMPDCCIGVDVIVGYPGESDALFQEGRAFLEELDVDYLHVFPYSERANTLAKTLPNKVQDRHRNDRVSILTALSDNKKAAFYASQVGTTRQVIFEEKQDGNKMLGFSENYVKVSTDYNPLYIGEKIACQLLTQNPDSITGEILEIATMHHSYRNDSIGSNLEALLAG